MPAAERDRSRLLIIDRRTGALRHGIFSDIAECFRSGDVLVLNNTKVFRCRIPGTKPGGGKAEIFLIEELGVNQWRALVRGTGGVGKKITCGADIVAEIVGEERDNVRVVRFSGVDDIRSVLPVIGKVPLPPYIRREPDSRDQERYQTMYASREGAVAAPTAGLHFTPTLLDTILSRGVEIVEITLHVGPGTFLPVRTEDISHHVMHAERYNIPEEAAEAVNRAVGESRRIIAVGTTTVRTLETAADENGLVRPGSGESSLFIRPGYRFRTVRGLITNFHLPKSTLLMLVAAFAGRERLLAAYREAVERQYRFYSYGDAMFIA